MPTLIDELQDEHLLIEAMLGSLRRYVQRRIGEGAGPADAQGFLDFFRLYAGEFHHAREEEVLIAALVREVGLPKERGPIAVIEAEHRELGELLAALAPLLCAAQLQPADAARLQDLAVRYSQGLWHHIDAENTVLFPEGAERLRRAGIIALPSRSPTWQENAARLGAESLLQRHPPLHDPEVFRGEGCALCPAYGVRCDGLEREWWTTIEWEEHDERTRHMD